MNHIDWRLVKVSSDETYHLINEIPLYPRRFTKVLKYHSPGIAPVTDQHGAYHIDIFGNDVYLARYQNTFGYYENRSAVVDHSGWFHIDIAGKAVYKDRYVWCGNYQENICTVKSNENKYFHIDIEGNRLYQEDYCYAGDYKEGYAVVCNNNGFHTHIDHQGKLLHNKWFQNLNVFHKGYACARDKDGWFHINKEGVPIYQERFRSLEPFYNNYAHAESFSGDLIIIDQNGNTVSVISSSIQDFELVHSLSSDMVGFWKTQTVYAAVQLKILDYLPGETQKIAHAVGLKDEYCVRLLRGLQEINLVEYKNSKWILTSKGFLLTPSDISSMASAAIIWGDSHYNKWSTLVNCLLEQSSSKDYFLQLSKMPQASKNYQNALSIYAKHDYHYFINQIDWTQHKNVIDAGGGTGTLLHSLLESVIHLKGVLIDLPPIIDLIQLPHPRAKYIGCDLFSEWLVTSDAILFARVLHDWDDEHAKQLLLRAKSHLSKNGKIYILEMILSESRGFGGLLDLNMLVMTGGKERSLKNWENLIEKTGLKITNIYQNNDIVSTLVLEHSLD